MQIVVAETYGMCFGVRDALRTAAEIEEPQGTTIHGYLVHNEIVLMQLAERGFSQTDERAREALPATRDVLITAHGISDRERERLLRGGKRLIDTTCPLVRRVHAAVQQLQREGFHVLVLGQKGHVEVTGLVEDLTSYEVIGELDQVAQYPHNRLGILCQTTLAPDLAEERVQRIRQLNPTAEIRVIDTICDPTRQRQQALAALISQVEAVVVVGGRNSNNTRQLVSYCEERSVPARHVTCAHELDFNWLAQFRSVGLTAGTSTLDTTLDEVHAALSQFQQPAH